MKLLTEIEEWQIGAAERFGDPAAVTTQIFARFVPRIDRPYADAIATFDKDTLFLSFEAGTVFPIEVDPDGMFVDPNGVLRTFGIEKICPGVWTLRPSLNIPGVIHAFICIYDVAAIAPWENRIIVVSSL